MNLTVPHYGREYYDEHRAQGLDYLGHGTWQEDYGRWLAESLELPEGLETLDVGCACGSIAEGLAKAGLTVDGVDLSEHMVALGRGKFRRVRRLTVCDAVNLWPYADASFDFLHSAQVAEHWRPEHVPLILRELRRVARPGALFFCALDTEELFARHGRAAGSPGEDPTHVCIRPLTWWHEQLAAAGWQVVTDHYRGALVDHPRSFISGAAGRGAYHYDWGWWVGRRR